MHAIVKNGVKEIANQHGRAATFMAKYDHRRAGSSSHVHQSLQSLSGEPLFHDPGSEHMISDTDAPLHGRAAGACARR
jgi:glutamine synthetase